MLTYRIYDSISSSLNEPIIVAKTMACNDFLSEFIKNEDSMSEDEQYALLATDGMLVKRPLVVGEGLVLTGFKEDEWKEKLL